MRIWKVLQKELFLDGDYDEGDFGRISFAIRFQNVNKNFLYFYLFLKKTLFEF